MFNDLFSGLFSAISDASCMDNENTDCQEGITSAVSAVGPMFLYVAVAITLVFILLTSIPKYSFKLGMFSDVLVRRIIFFAGLIFCSLTLWSAYTVCETLCGLRSDGDVAWENFKPLININFFISLAIYPVLFWLVAFCFNRFLNRRKLNTVFVSNNKIFGII